MDRQISLLYTGEDFIAHAEYAGGFLFLHCEVNNWNLATLRKIKRGIGYLKKQCLKSGYNGPLLTYTQNPRWVKLVGGKYVRDFEVENEKFEVWAWE